MLRYYTKEGLQEFESPAWQNGEEVILERFKAFRETREQPVRAYAFTAVRQAVQMAVNLSKTLSEQLSRSASAEKPAPPLIYIGGSTFVVAEALPLFRT